MVTDTEEPRLKTYDDYRRESMLVLNELHFGTAPQRVVIAHRLATRFHAIAVGGYDWRSGRDG